MDPSTRPVRVQSRRIPRTRGDGPKYGRIVTRVTLDPPHARGWTWLKLHSAGSPAGSPARAGMDPRNDRYGVATVGIPRTRGDGPNIQSTVHSI